MWLALENSFEPNPHLNYAKVEQLHQPKMVKWMRKRASTDIGRLKKHRYKKTAMIVEF